LQDHCYVNNQLSKYYVNNGIITFNQHITNGLKITDLFDVYVGIVSGKDEVYKVSFGNIDVLIDKNKIDKFIFIDKFPSGITDIDNHLLNNKSILKNRRIKKFNDNNWYEWGAPRNISAIKNKYQHPCIYVKNITRSKDVAFIDTVQYFGGSLLCLIPKTNDIELSKIVEYFNTDLFQKDYIYSGRFKIGHKQLSNVLISI
jgi:adenine-specific DNA-methyltransferase